MANSLTKIRWLIVFLDYFKISCMYLSKSLSIWKICIGALFELTCVVISGAICAKTAQNKKTKTKKCHKLVKVTLGGMNADQDSAWIQECQWCCNIGHLRHINALKQLTLSYWAESQTSPNLSPFNKVLSTAMLKLWNYVCMYALCIHRNVIISLAIIICHSCNAVMSLQHKH